VVLGIAFVVACIYAFSLPKTYSCKVMLAPELSTTTSRNSLSALASSFGLNMGATRNGSEALFPTLYPDLMNSVDFKTSLFPVKVRRDKDTKEMTYYDYLLKEQKRPWWSSAIGTVVGGIAGLFSSDDATGVKSNTNKEVDPFRLTKKQTAIAQAINSRVRCDVDKKTLVITIMVVDQDPLICATVADSVKNRLQRFITDYRTSKVREDLKYNQKIYTEAKREYDKARQLYASFSDANQDVILQSVRTKLNDLENEMQLKFNAYNAISVQLQEAKAKVQQETPAFTTLQSATVPVGPSAPRKSRILLVWLFLAFLGTTLWAFYKDGHLKSLLGLS
jgi:capsular polysaccharide biosynthesis protein